jgi:hypothetical protein
VNGSPPILERLAVRSHVSSDALIHRRSNPRGDRGDRNRSCSSCASSFPVAYSDDTLNGPPSRLPCFRRRAMSDVSSMARPRSRHRPVSCDLLDVHVCGSLPTGAACHDTLNPRGASLSAWHIHMRPLGPGTQPLTTGSEPIDHNGGDCPAATHDVRAPSRPSCDRECPRCNATLTRRVPGPSLMEPPVRWRIKAVILRSRGRGGACHRASGVAAGAL